MKSAIHLLTIMLIPFLLQTSLSEAKPPKLELSKICVTSDLGLKREFYNSTGIFRNPPTELRIFLKDNPVPHVIREGDELFRSSLDFIKHDEMNGLVRCKSTAEFLDSEVGPVKVDLQNYAESGCKDDRYIKSALDSAKKWEMSKTASHLSSEINRDDATAGIRAAIYSASRTQLTAESCARFVKNNIEALNQLTLARRHKTSDRASKATVN